ncbi:MAG: DUF255 domain-containing protein [Saprospiraceae bacterium]
MIISFGYSSCHWCHVMESLSGDTAVSNFMNRRFVSIKVDREERPDVDQVYMNACQIANANSMCGWPLSGHVRWKGHSGSAHASHAINGWDC